MVLNRSPLTSFSYTESIPAISVAPPLPRTGAYGSHTQCDVAFFDIRSVSFGAS